ncbi:MAG: hypothetical protein MO852_13500 [Candidatus Devosia euplotis]|nr:hypothetical protein [Candidatus Devosia euplotis]
MTKLAPIALILISVLSISACKTTERTLSGTAIGGAGGAVAGSLIAQK